MITKWLIVLFIGLVFQSIPAHAQVALGLYAGLDRSKFYGDTPPGIDYDYKQGYALGITLDFKVASPDIFLSLRPNLTRNGANIIDVDSTLIGNVLLFPITTHYIMLPVIAQIYVTRGFYANAGFDVGWLASAEADTPGGNTSLHPQASDWTGNVIFGFGFSVPMGRTSFNLEFSYAQGLSTFTKPDRIEDGTSPRLRASRIRLSGYFIIFAGKKRIQGRRSP